jgi:hypothetical protein
VTVNLGAKAGAARPERVRLAAGDRTDLRVLQHSLSATETARTRQAIDQRVSAESPTRNTNDDVTSWH